MNDLYNKDRYGPSLPTSESLSTSLKKSQYDAKKLTKNIKIEFNNFVFF